MQMMYRILLPLCALWLLGWIFFSWGAVQDDALIHLRYADNLYWHHMISYDGVHANYGASSLLYVSILALLRNWVSSPNLARGTSSVVHILLFAALAGVFAFSVPRASKLARLLGAILLALLVSPSAVRWLDDGMETGLVLGFTTLLCWLIVRQTRAPAASTWSYLALATVAFFAVLLRIELLLVCGIGCMLIACSRGIGPAKTWRGAMARRGRIVLACSHLVLGGLLACAVIVWKMHVLLPDTAVAKSLGRDHWRNVLQDTATTLGGAFSFGLGMLLFWLLSLFLLLLHAKRRSLANLLANLPFPIILSLSALRGQEIQGARYFVWTFLFSILWNILQLAQLAPAPESNRRDNRLVAAFLVLLAISLPVETKVMYRVLLHRREVMRAFEGQHLEVL